MESSSVNKQKDPTEIAEPETRPDRTHSNGIIACLKKGSAMRDLENDFPDSLLAANGNRVI